VRRLWLPRIRDELSLGGAADFVGPLGDMSLTGILVVLIAALVLIFSPLVFFALELLVIPLVFAYRIVFRRPWTVEAAAKNERLRWQARGWRRSGAAVEAIAAVVARGEDPRQIGVTLRGSETSLT
jgi:hypothetical protein